MSGWHPEDIKAAVRKRGTTLAEIGARVGMTRQTIALTLVRPSAAGEAAIAAFLDVAPHILWPSRYNSDGSRKRPQPAENYRRRARFAKPIGSTAA